MIKMCPKMSDESKAFICGMLCFAGLSFIVGACLFQVLTIKFFVEGYSQGKQEGYKEGYIMALVNQKKGIPHEFILVEQDNGEFKWKNSSELVEKHKANE